jgi:hypothetical protein
MAAAMVEAFGLGDEDSVWVCPAGEEIEALSSYVDIMVASPFIHFETIRIETFWKFGSTTKCEGQNSQSWACL